MELILSLQFVYTLFSFKIIVYGAISVHILGTDCCSYKQDTPLLSLCLLPFFWNNQFAYCFISFIHFLWLLFLSDILFSAFVFQDNQGPLVSLMMTYIFTAMTHLAIDIRLMAFKCCDLLVQHYPASFSLYAEEVINEIWYL